MKIGTVIRASVLAVLFGASGFLIGRQMPAHHFVIEDRVYLLDTSTGRVCSLIPDVPVTPCSK
jgi:hypothetical protein